MFFFYADYSRLSSLDYAVSKLEMAFHYFLRISYMFLQKEDRYVNIKNYTYVEIWLLYSETVLAELRGLKISLKIFKVYFQ